MPSFKSTSFFVAAVLAGVAKADYIIDPDSVSASERAAWCQSELSTCPLICNQIVEGEPLVNDCDSDALTYGCVCADGTRPNVSEYTLTLPYFTCIEWGNQCVEGCGSDNGCSGSCREDNLCGAQDPPRSNSTSTSTTSSATASATSDAEDAANTKVLGQDDDSDDSTGSAVALGRSYGLTFIAGALFVGFAML